MIVCYDYFITSGSIFLMYTQFNLQSPTNPTLTNWFSAVKVDNSSSTEEGLPPAKSPDFTYEAEVQNDSMTGTTTELIQIAYDRNDNFKKKLNYMGITTDLLEQGVSDHSIDIGLEGAVNPITFLVKCRDIGQNGYIYNAVDDAMIVINNSGTAGPMEMVIADAGNFSAIYDDLNSLPQARNLVILIESPNPLMPNGAFVKSFTFQKNFQSNTLFYTFKRADSSVFYIEGDAIDEGTTPPTINGITLEDYLDVNDGITQWQYTTKNIEIIPVQRSGYIQNADGTYSITTPEPIANGTVFNRNFDGFRIILETDANELTIGQDVLEKERVDNGLYRKTSSAALKSDAKESKRVSQSRISASPIFRNPFKKFSKRLK